MTQVIQTGPAFELKEKVAQLADKILAKHPTMPTLLREIHTTLRQYPEQVTCLNEEEICIIISGLKVQTQTTFAESVTKPSEAKNLKAKLSKNAAGALGLD